MKTVKQLIDDLSKFPEDAKCYAYEGEVIGIIVTDGEQDGVIYCSESEDHEPTEFFK